MRIARLIYFLFMDIFMGKYGQKISKRLLNYPSRWAGKKWKKFGDMYYII